MCTQSCMKTDRAQIHYSEPEFRGHGQAPDHCRGQAQKPRCNHTYVESGHTFGKKTRYLQPIMYRAFSAVGEKIRSRNNAQRHMSHDRIQIRRHRSRRFPALCALLCLMTRSIQLFKLSAIPPTQSLRTRCHCSLACSCCGR